MSGRPNSRPSEIELREDLKGSVLFASRRDLSRLSPTLRARLENADYIAAEALEVAEDRIPKRALERVRNRIARGRLSEAENALAAWSVGSDDSLLRAEGLLESARVAFSRGDWEGTARLATQGLDSDHLPSVSRLTLLQLRAIARLESGAHASSAMDIESARALVELYPHSPSRFYLDATEAKLDIERDRIDLARQKIRRLYGETGTPILDRFLTLLRLESHLARHLNVPFEYAAIAAIHVARRMGDRLYEGLAWAEVESSSDPLVSDAARPFAEEFGAQFERVEKLRRSFPQRRTMGPLASEFGTSFPRPEATIDHVVTLSAGWIVRLTKGEPPAIRCLTLSAQQETLLCVLCKGPIAVEAFFEKAWGIRYRPLRHLSTVKVALKRLRDASGLEVRMRSGDVTISSGILILDSIAFP